MICSIVRTTNRRIGKWGITVKIQFYNRIKRLSTMSKRANYLFRGAFMISLTKNLWQDIVSIFRDDIVKKGRKKKEDGRICN